MKIIARYSSIIYVFIYIGLISSSLSLFLNIRLSLPVFLPVIILLFTLNFIQNTKLVYLDDKLWVYRKYMFWKPKYIYDLSNIQKIYIKYGIAIGQDYFIVYFKNGSRSNKILCLWSIYDSKEKPIIKELNKLGIEVEFQRYFSSQVFYPKMMQ